ncbi:MAG: DMT family transporter [Pseudomonadota bacterium]
MSRPTIWADIAVLGVAALWGASYPVAKEALTHAPVLALIFYRFVLAAIVMSVVSYRELRRIRGPDITVAALLGCILWAIFLAETWGVALTSATNTALLISLCVVFTPFLEFGLRRRLPPKGVLAGAGVAVIGVLILAGGATKFGAGDALVLLAAVLRAIMVVSTKRLLEGRQISSIALTAVQAVTVSLLTLAILTVQSGLNAATFTLNRQAWVPVLFLSLFCTIAAFYVQNAAVRLTSATRVSFIMGTEPLFGFALAWLLLSEAATAHSLVGAFLIVSGTFIGLWFEAPRAQEVAPG